VATKMILRSGLPRISQGASTTEGHSSPARLAGLLVGALTVPLLYYWWAAGFIHLLDEEGRLVAQRDSEPQGGMRPTNGWQVGEEVVDRYGVLVGEGTPSGKYELVVGMYEPASGERLPIVDNEGIVIGDKVSLGIVEVVDG